MGAKVLVLCFLLFCTSGPVKATSLDYEWNDNIDLHWLYLKKPHLFGRDYLYWKNSHLLQMKRLFDDSYELMNVNSEEHSKNVITPIEGRTQVTKNKNSNIALNEGSGGNSIVSASRIPTGNYIVSNTESELFTPFESKASHLESSEQSEYSRHVRNSKITPKTEIILATSTITSSLMASRGKEEIAELRNTNPRILSSESNSSSTENSNVTNVQITSSTDEFQNETQNSTEIISVLNHTESFTVNETEVISTTDLDTSSIIDDKFIPTERINVSTTETNPSPSDISSDNSVSHSTATTAGEKQTEGNTPSSDSTEAKTKLTTNETVAASTIQSLTISNSIPSTKESTSVSLTSTTKSLDVTTDFISSSSDSKESKSSTSGYTTGSTSQDHVIRNSSIKTARVIVSVVFIVIALVAVVILAIYMFRIQRKTVKYDELMLLT